MSKYSLAQSMFFDLPNGVKDLLETPIGTFSTLTEPTTEGEANILAGKFLAEFQNNVLVPMSGLPPVALMLYVGSLNPAIVSSLFANLEYLGGGGALDLIAPKNGGIYPGYFDAWQIRGTDLDSVIVTIGDDEFSLDRNDNDFSKNWPIAIGEHTATITGYREEEEIDSVEVSFSVVSYETLEPIVTPVNEETKQVEFRYELPENSGASSGEITVSDGINTWNVVLVVTGTIASGVALIASAPVTVTVAGIIAFASGAQLAINEYIANVG